MLCENLYGQNVLLDQSVEVYASVLLDSKADLPARFRALFSLRNINTDAAVTIIAAAFKTTESALLKHELAYCLGQMRLESAVDCLRCVLADQSEDPMVRHEAGEALGAIGDRDSLPLLKHHFMHDPNVSVRETCEIAIDNIENNRQIGCPCQFPGDIQFGSVDPAPAMDLFLSVDELGVVLLDRKLPMFKRYQAMFSLRNRASDEAVLMLCRGLEDPSALFRHEVAYVLGQLQNPLAIDRLHARLMIPSEAGMVRHECAEALGSIADDRCMAILRGYLDDPEPVVRESCQVALDICAFERSNELH